jgi:hypothetical protein
MRTVLHAIIDAATCRDTAKDGNPQLRGVVVQWVDLPESGHLPERVVRCYATDGKALAVVHVDPGKGWPEHGALMIHPDAIKQLGQLLKRVDNELDERMPEVPIVGKIETWHNGYDAEGRMMQPRQILRLDVPCCDDGMVVPLVDTPPLSIEGVMAPRRLVMGCPAGRLSTNYVQAAQAAVGHWGPPTWYTDGRCAFLFNRTQPERAHDFALVMPVVGDDEDRELYPWGRPEGDAPAEPIVLLEDQEAEELGLGPDLDGADLGGDSGEPPAPPPGGPKPDDVVF